MRKTYRKRVIDGIKSGKSNIEISDEIGCLPRYVRDVRRDLKRKESNAINEVKPKKRGRKKQPEEEIESPEDQQEAARLAIGILGEQVSVLKKQIRDLDELIQHEIDGADSLKVKNLVTSKAILLDKVIVSCDKIGKLSKLFGKKTEVKASFNPEILQVD